MTTQTTKDFDMDPKVEYDENELAADVERQRRLTKTLLFKVDTRRVVLPLLALLFLCSFLDRTNVGNAKIIGMEEDLGINNSQYNQGLAVFYATYIAR
ncbi:major facilitator superfamily transporter [Colletotrichum tofieldiae]|nr:major facilitator superfamily transporter [Colletotrichum tofieldiae]GKT71371.1 major facilitator superfamily transporter [Colletotrichum tofieldiae]GKT93702.1 major facilitator superfamily transporter [Colletotrichum tofieldiae]